MEHTPRIHLRYRMDTSLVRQITLGLMRYRREQRLRWQLFGMRASFELSQDLDVSLWIPWASATDTESFREARLKVCLLEKPPKGSGVFHLPFDLVGAGELAFEYFADRGFRFFAVVRGSYQYRYLELIEAFLRVAQRHGFVPIELVYNEGRYTAESIDALRRLSEKGTVAVFAGNDPYALQLLALVDGLDLQVPGQLAILGAYDGELDCELGVVPLSSLRWDGFHIGYQLGESFRRYFETGVYEPPAPFAAAGIASRQSTDVLAVEDSALARAVAFALENLSETIQVRDLMDASGLNRRTLERRFQAAFSEGPGDFIRRHRLQRAKQLMRARKYTVSEVAELCGFSEARLLYSLFRKEEGCGPTDWLRREQDLRSPGSS